MSQVYTFGSASSCCEKACRWQEAVVLSAVPEANAFAFSGAINALQLKKGFKRSGIGFSRVFDDLRFTSIGTSQEN